METFGTKLLKQRNKSKLTAQEVADSLGVTQGTVHNWESDKSSFKVEYLPKLAEILGVSITDLIPEGTTLKIMDNSNLTNHDNAVVGFEVKIEAPEVYLKLLDSKDKIIELLTKRCEDLEASHAAKDKIIEALRAEVGRLRQG